MGLVVKVVDLNNDGNNEIILGTGQESGSLAFSGSTAFFYVMQTDGKKSQKNYSVVRNTTKVLIHTISLFMISTRMDCWK